MKPRRIYTGRARRETNASFQRPPASRLGGLTYGSLPVMKFPAGVTILAAGSKYSKDTGLFFTTGSCDAFRFILPVAVLWFFARRYATTILCRTSGEGSACQDHDLSARALADQRRWLR